MIYNFISAKQIVAKVMADLDLSEESFRISDAMEWIAEGIEKIGSVKQLKRKTTGVDGIEPLIVTGYQAQLPSDMFRMNQAMFSINPNGPWYPMSVATGSFNQWSDETSGDRIVDGLSANTVLISVLRSIYDDMSNNFEYTWYNELEFEDAKKLMLGDSSASIAMRNNIKSMLKYSNLTTNMARDIGFKYTLKPGYIQTNMKDGYIRLSYDAVYTDESGYPMVPDLISYTEAIYWYVTMKLKYPEYLSGKLNREIYYDIRRSWNFYCKQAYGESMMPTGDEMETIKNVWTKLIPDVYANENGYANIGEPQITKNLNRNYGRKYW
jgi:hypothetical protein